MGWKIELWDQPEFASGAQRLAMVEQWVAGSMRLSIDGTDQLQLTAPWNANWLGTVIPRHVLRVTDELGRVTEWRVIRVLDGRGTDRADTIVEAESLLTELARPLVLQTQPGGATSFTFNVYDSTAAQIYDQFIAPRLTAEGLTHFVRDTSFPTEPMTFGFERFSCLELLTEIADRTQTERWVERDAPNSRYLVKLGVRGSGEPTVRTAFNRGNLQTYVRDRDSLLVSTVTIPTGKKVDGAAEKSTLGFNAWRVVSATGLTLELEDPAGGDAPIAFDDQLNGYYALRPLEGSPVQILDSSATGQTITVADTRAPATYGGAQTQGGGSILGSSATLTYPTGTATGDVIFAGLVARMSASGTVTAPTGWTEILATGRTAATGGYDTRAWAGYIVAGATLPTGTISFSPNAYYAWRTIRVTDVAATGPVVVSDSGFAFGGSTPSVPISATGSGTNQAYILLAARESSTSQADTRSDYENVAVGKTFSPSVSITSSFNVRWLVGVGVRSDGLGIEVGEHVQILGTSSGALAYELKNPTGVSTYGRVVGTVDDEELREERNWLENGLFRTWGSGVVATGFVTVPTISSTQMRRDYGTNVREFVSFGVTSITATGSDWRYVITVPTGSTVSHGDLIYAGGTLAITDYTNVIQQISATGNTVTCIVEDDISVSTGVLPAIRRIGGPSTNGSVYTYAHNLPKAYDLYSPTIRVKYIPGYEAVWGSIGFTSWQIGTSPATATGGKVRAILSVTPIDTVDPQAYVNDYGALELPGQVFTTGQELEVLDGVVRVGGPITTDSDVQLRFDTAAISSGDEWHMVRWMQLHLGTDSQVPPVEGSHGNRIWQRGNQHLRVFGVPPATYQVTLVDLVRGQELGLAVADDGIALGGTVRLVDSEIGQVDLRIVELRLNATDPYDSVVTLANIPPRLAKIARRARFAPPTRPDPTPPVQKPADEEPSAPLPTILAPTIGVTTPSTIKLVGGTWSIYT